MQVTPARRNDREGLSPENRKAICYRIAADLGADDVRASGDLFDKVFEPNTVEGLFEVRDAMLKEQRAAAERAGRYTPRVSMEGTHPEHVETRTTAEMFADALFGII